MLKRTYRFKNGATLIYRKRTSNKATAINAGFFCGHQYANNGLPHFFEHMFFKGTEKRSMEQIIDDRTNITFLNAYTNSDFVCVDFYQSNKRIVECFEFASDVLLNSTFDKDKLKNEVKVINEEKVRYIDRMKKELLAMHELFIKKDYVDLQTYADRIFGTDKFLKSITREQLIEYRDKHFVTDKFIISVASSLSFRRIKKLVQKYFLSKIKKPETPSIILPLDTNPINQDEGINIVKNNDNGYKVVLTIKMDVKPLAYRFDYNLDCLSESLSLRKDLYHFKVREEGLAYACRTGVDYNELTDTLWFGLDFTTSSLENIEKILKIFGDSINVLKKDGLSEKEIEVYKENHLVSRDTKRPASYKDMVQDNLLFYQKYGDEKPKTNKQIDKFYDKVTTKTIKENILKCFDENNIVHMTIMGNVDKKDLKSIDEYKRLVFGF